MLIILIYGCGRENVEENLQPLTLEDLNLFNITYVKKPIYHVKSIIFRGDIQGKVSCGLNTVKIVTKDSIVYKYSQNFFKSFFKKSAYFYLKGAKKSIHAEKLKYAKLRTGRSGSLEEYTIHFLRSKGCCLIDTSAHEILKINSHIAKINKPKLFKLKDLDLKRENKRFSFPEDKVFQYYDSFLKDNNLDVNLSLGCKYSPVDSTIITSNNMKYYGYNREVLHDVSMKRYLNPFSLSLIYLDFEVVQELAEYYLNKNEVIFFLALNLPISSELNNSNFRKMKYKITNLVTKETRFIEIKIKKFVAWEFYRFTTYPSQYRIKEKNGDGEILKEYTVDIEYALRS